MLKNRILFPLLVIFLFLYSCMPVNRAYTKFKYRNDFWVKSSGIKKSASDKRGEKDGAESEISADAIEQINPEEVYSAVETETEIISRDGQTETSASEPIAGNGISESKPEKKAQKLTYREVKKLLKDEISEKQRIIKKSDRSDRPFPVFGLISVISGGLSVLTGIWTPIIGYSAYIPEIMVIYVLFFAVTVACGIVSLVRKEDKRGLAIAGLAAAAFSLFLFGVMNLLFSELMYY